MPMMPRSTVLMGHFLYPIRCVAAEQNSSSVVMLCVCVCVACSFVHCYCFGVRCYAQSSVGCASDVDGDGFDFDMDDGETSDTLSNKVGYVICVRRNFCITFTLLYLSRRRCLVVPPLKTANQCGPPSWVRGCDLEDLTGSWSPVCAWCRYFVCRRAKEHGVRLQSCRGGWRKEYGAQTDHSSALLGTATHTLNVGHRQRGMKRQLEVAHTTLPIKTTQQWLAGDTTLLEESAAWLPGERTRAAVANTTTLLVDTVNTLRVNVEVMQAFVDHWIFSWLT